VLDVYSHFPCASHSLCSCELWPPLLIGVLAYGRSVDSSADCLTKQSVGDSPMLRGCAGLQNNTRHAVGYVGFRIRPENN